VISTEAQHFPVNDRENVIQRNLIRRTRQRVPSLNSAAACNNSAVAQFAEDLRQKVWRHLLNMRKAGQLPKLGPAKSKPPKLSPEHESHIRDLLGEAVGKRDRLPYTDRFDQLVNEFNKTQARKLSPHLVWRIVAKLAK